MPVKRGPFGVIVTTTGELRASQSVPIMGPSTAAQAAGIMQTKILSLVPEGSLVRPGDVIATLDPTQILTNIQSARITLQKAEAGLTSAQLDSALTLAQAREDVRNAQFQLEQKKLLKDEAQYEAPSVKRQAEIDYEQAEHALEQAKVSLTTKTRQAVAKMSQVGADVAQQRMTLQNLEAAQRSFTITAPAPGMVIYRRSWTGGKQGAGSSWTAWDPVVATLPDLSRMESRTYVNEVDVQKITVGQPVRLTLDANPDKRLTGVVTQIANVGEQRPNQDAKVFEVTVAVQQADTTLRPGMTTVNMIETASIPNVLYVPLDAVVTEDGFSYVYKKEGHKLVRQMIETGLANEDEIVVRRGLTEGDYVTLAIPANKTGIETRVVPGLKPKTAPQPAVDTAPKTPAPGIPAGLIPPGAKVTIQRVN